MKLYDIYLNGRYVDTIEAASAKAAEAVAKRHFGQEVKAVKAK
jgi:hypothetical protein